MISSQLFLLQLLQLRLLLLKLRGGGHDGGGQGLIRDLTLVARVTLTACLRLNLTLLFLHSLFNLLFLLQRLHKRRLQPVRVFRFQGFFLVGVNTLKAHDLLRSKLDGLPQWAEVFFALQAHVRRQDGIRVFRFLRRLALKMLDLSHNLFETNETDEFVARSARQESDLRRRRFGGRNFQQGLLQLLSQRQFCGRLLLLE